MMNKYKFENHAENSYALQKLARYEMLCRFEQDILLDIAVCELEGWEKMEFIKLIQEKIIILAEKKGK